MISRSRKYKVVLPMLFLVLSLSSIQKVYAEDFTYKTTSNLNMRTGAGTGNRILLTIPRGKEITYIASSGKWYQISYGGKTGYVSSSFVRKENQAQNSTAVPAAGGDRVRTTSALNIRTGPSAAYKRIATIPKQTVVTFSGIKDGWYKVTYAGKTGYASGKYLSVLPKEAAPGPVKAPATNASAGSSVETETVTTKKYYTTSPLNMRSGPTKDYPIVQVLPKNAELTYLGQDGWYKVSYNGKEGYASNRFIRIEEIKTTKPQAVEQSPVAETPEVIEPAVDEPVASIPSPVVPIETPAASPVVEDAAAVETGVLVKTPIFYTTTTLNMRTGPSATHGLILTLPKGVHLRSLGVENGWHKVSYNGKTGYASGKYVVGNEVYTVDGIIVVNKGIALPAGFNPGINPEAKAAFDRMNQEARSKGLTLNLFSGFRSYAYQKDLFNRYASRDGVRVAETYSARAGHSEHQTGLTFDIGGADSSKWTKALFAETKEGKWLAEHAPKYGFILRYPKGKEHITGYIYEPWHFRYVGVELAKKITESGLTLDEYFGCVHPNY